MPTPVTINIDSKADTRGFDDAAKRLQGLSAEAKRFVDDLRAGVGIDLGGRLVQGIADVPNQLQAMLERGVKFNATMSDSEVAVANVLKKFQGLNEEAAKQEAAKAMAKIVELEPQTSAGLQDMVQGLLATAATSQSAGISIEENIDLIGKFANAMSNAAIPAEQLSQEMRSIMTGNINSDSALAKTLQISNSDVNTAKEAGNLYGFLVEKIGALGEAGDTFAVKWSSLQTTIDKLAGTLAQPLFDVLAASLVEINKALQDPKAVAAMEELGVKIGGVASDLAGLTKFAIENASALITVAEVTGRLGLAFGALKIASLVIDIGRGALAWAASTLAIQTNTKALAANKLASAGAGIGGTGKGMAGMLGGPVGVGLTIGLLANQAIAMYADHMEAVAEASEKANSALQQQSQALELQVRQSSTAGERVAVQVKLKEREAQLQKQIAADRGITNGEDLYRDLGIDYEATIKEQNLALLKQELSKVQAMQKHFDEIAGTREAAAKKEQEIAQSIKEQEEAAKRMAAAKNTIDDARFDNLSDEEKQAELSAKRQSAYTEIQKTLGNRAPGANASATDISSAVDKYNNDPSLVEGLTEEEKLKLTEKAAEIATIDRQLGGLNRSIDADKQKTADRAADLEVTQKIAAEELAISEMRAAGSDEEAKRRERLLEIYKQQLDYEQRGIAYGGEAWEMARRKIDSESEIAAIKDKQNQLSQENLQTSRDLSPREGRIGNRGGRHFDSAGRDITDASQDLLGNRRQVSQLDAYQAIQGTPLLPASPNAVANGQAAAKPTLKPVADAANSAAKEMVAEVRSAASAMSNLASNFGAAVTELKDAIAEVKGEVSRLKNMA